MEDIKILSYNIFLRPPPVHDKLSDYKDEVNKYFIFNYINNIYILLYV